MGQTRTVNWGLPVGMLAEVETRALADGVTEHAWLVEAADLWSSDAAACEANRERVGYPIPLLPRDTQEALRVLHANVADRRPLNLFLYLLAGGRWPVTQVCAAVLQESPTKISDRIRRGRDMTVTGHPLLATWLEGLPPVPYSTDLGGITGEAVVPARVKLPVPVYARMVRKADVLGWSLSRAFTTAVTEAMNASGFDAFGRDLGLAPIRRTS